MGFLSKLNKKLGFSKGTKERARALKRREALGLTPKYVEDPMGRILSPGGGFNRSALERKIAEMRALNPGMGMGQIEAPSMPRRGGPRRGDMGMPRMPRIDDGRMRAMPIGPGEAIRKLKEKRGGDMGMPRRPRLPGMGMIGTPQPIPEQIPMSPESYFNPTIFGQQMGDMDFEQMPEISPVDMSNLQMPTLPREISQMDLPQMPEGLPSMQDVQGMPQMGMNDMQPRRMMAGGDEVFMDSTPEQIAFSIEAEIKNLMNEYEMAANNGENERAMMLNEQINELEARRIQMMNQGRSQAGVLEDPRMDVRDVLAEKGITISNMDRQMLEGGRPQLAGGGDFPDLTGDGKVTQADILKGRGVYAEGDEVMMMQETDMMAPGNQEIEASLMEVQGMQPDMQVLDQYVQMVTQMVQAGASEAEVIESLRQAGLDDDDIAAVFQAVMETMQGSMEQGGIDSELAQLS